MKTDAGYGSLFRKNRIILSVILLLAVLTAAFMLLYSVRVRYITVKNTEGETAEAVIRRVFPDEEDRQLFSVLFKCAGKNLPEDAFESVAVQLKGLTGCEIEAVMRPAVLSVTDGTNRYPVDEKGYVLFGNVTDELPPVEGIVFGEAVPLYPLSAEKEKVLAYAVHLAGLLEAEEVLFEGMTVENDSITVHMNDVDAAFGTDAMTGEKVHVLKQQIPYFEGLKGTVHLEKYDGSEKNEAVTFEVNP